MTHASHRRTFLLQVIAATTAVAATSARAADEISTVKLTEADPYARSMGFRLDTNKVDQAKYPRHDAATQHCSKCQLYSGAPGAADGPCSFYGGRLVPVNGWCRNFKARQA
jgi:hypothetical protein